MYTSLPSMNIQMKGIRLPFYRIKKVIDEDVALEFASEKSGLGIRYEKDPEKQDAILIELIEKSQKSREVEEKLHNFAEIYSKYAGLVKTSNYQNPNEETKQSGSNIGKYIAAGATAAAILGGAFLYMNTQDGSDTTDVPDKSTIDFEDIDIHDTDSSDVKVLGDNDLKVLGTNSGVAIPIGKPYKEYVSSCLPTYDRSGNKLYDLGSCDDALYGFVALVKGSDYEYYKDTFGSALEGNVLMMYAPNPMTGIEVKKLINPADHDLEQINKIKFDLQVGSDSIESDKPMANHLTLRVLVDGKKIDGWNLGAIPGYSIQKSVKLSEPVNKQTELIFQLYNLSDPNKEWSNPVVYIDNIKFE